MQGEHGSLINSDILAGLADLNDFSALGSTVKAHRAWEEKITAEWKQNILSVFAIAFGRYPRLSRAAEEEFEREFRRASSPTESLEPANKVQEFKESILRLGRQNRDIYDETLNEIRELSETGPPDSIQVAIAQKDKSSSPLVALVNANHYAIAKSIEPLKFTRMSAFLKESKIPTELIDTNKLNLSAEDLAAKITILANNYPYEQIFVCFNLAIIDKAYFVKFLSFLPQELKAEKRFFICARGYLPSIYKGELLREIPDLDFIIAGEAEFALVKAVRALSEGKTLEGVKNIIYRCPERQIIINPHRVLTREELDSLPFLDWGIIQDRPEMFSKKIMLDTSYGCAGRCAFCIEHSFFNEANAENRKEGIKLKDLLWRPRSAERVVDEIEFLHRKFGVTGFDFWDNDFIGTDPGRARAIAEGIIKRKLKISYWGLARADSICKAGKEVLALMQKSGLKQLFVGVESDNEEELIHFRKGVTREQNRKAIEMLQGLGIFVRIGIIIFCKGSSLALIRNDVEFIKKYKLQAGIAYPARKLMIYSTTLLYKKCIENGDKLIQVGDVMFDFEFDDSRVVALFNIAKQFSNATNRLMVYFRELFELLYYAPSRSAEKRLAKKAAEYYLKLKEIEFDFFDQALRLAEGDDTGYTLSETESRHRQQIGELVNQFAGWLKTQKRYKDELLFLKEACKPIVCISSSPVTPETSSILAGSLVTMEGSSEAELRGVIGKWFKEEWERRFQRIAWFISEGRGRLYRIIYAGELVGFVRYYDTADKAGLYISNLLVKPEYRFRGIARDVIGIIAKANPYKYLAGESVEFYRKLGFENRGYRYVLPARVLSISSPVRNRNDLLAELKITPMWGYVGTALTYDRTFKPFEFNGRAADFNQALTLLFRRMITRNDTLLVYHEAQLNRLAVAEDSQVIASERQAVLEKLSILLSAGIHPGKEFLFFNGENKPIEFGGNPLCLLNAYDEAIAASISPYTCFTRQMFLAAPLDNLKALLKQPDSFREEITLQPNSEELEEDTELDDDGSSEEKGRSILSALHSEQSVRLKLKSGLVFLACCAQEMMEDSQWVQIEFLDSENIEVIGNLAMEVDVYENVGIIHLDGLHGTDDPLTGERVEPVAMLVGESYQRNGMGSLLMLFALAAAQIRGLRLVRVQEVLPAAESIHLILGKEFHAADNVLICKPGKDMSPYPDFIYRISAISPGTLANAIGRYVDDVMPMHFKSGNTNSSSPVIRPSKTQIKIIAEGEAAVLRSRITEAYAKTLGYKETLRVAVYCVDPVFIIVLSQDEGPKPPQLKVLATYIRLLQRELDGLQRSANGNIFFSILSSFSEEPLSVFSRSMIKCMIDQRGILQGATVVDFGTGEGILCRIALGLGGLRTYGFDHYPVLIAYAKWLSFLEGWLIQFFRMWQFKFKKVDLNSWHASVLFWRNHLSSKATVALINLGPWEWYKGANLKSLKRASSWPAMQLIVNGGYVSGQPLHETEITRATALLKEKGFSVSRVEYELTSVLVAKRVTGGDGTSSSPAGAKLEREVFFSPHLGGNLYVYRGMHIPEKTTILSLNALQLFFSNMPWLSGIKFMDIGCGTGILSIRTNQMTGGSGVAVDIDDQAVQAAKENVEQYRLSGSIRVIQGDLFANLGEEKFDLAISNFPGWPERQKVADRFFEGLRGHLNLEGRAIVIWPIEFFAVPGDWNPAVDENDLFGIVRKHGFQAQRMLMQGDYGAYDVQVIASSPVDGTKVSLSIFSRFDWKRFVNFVSGHKEDEARVFARAYCRSADSYYATQKYPEVIHAYDMAWKIDVNAPVDYKKLADAHFYLGHYAVAKSYYLVFLKSGAEDADICRNLGIIFAGSGDFAQAAIYFSKAIVYNPKFTEQIKGLAVKSGVKLGLDMASVSSPVELLQTLSLEKRQLAADIARFLPSFPIEGNRKIVVNGKEYIFKKNFTRSMYGLGELIFIVLLSDYYGGLPSSVSLQARALARLYKDKLGDLYAQHSNSIFFISPWSAQPGEPLNDFTVSTIAFILAEREMFKEATVVDFGAGTGVLADVALTLGARRVILIENNFRDLSFAKAVLEEHGWTEGYNFYILNANLNQKVLIRSYLHKFQDAGNLIAFLNMGPWRHYGSANRDALETIIEYGVFDLVINTGYLNMSIEAAHREEFQRAKKLLEAAGYQVDGYLFSPKGYLGAAGLLAEKIRMQPVAVPASSPLSMAVTLRFIERLENKFGPFSGEWENYWQDRILSGGIPTYDPAMVYGTHKLLIDNLLEVAGPLAGKRILKIGCGFAELLRYLKEEHRAEVAGVEKARFSAVVLWQIGWAVEMRSTQEYICGNLGSFDVIISVRVLETLGEREAEIIAREMTATMKKGGVQLHAADISNPQTAFLGIRGIQVKDLFTSVIHTSGRINYLISVSKVSSPVVRKKQRGYELKEDLRKARLLKSRADQSLNRLIRKFGSNHILESYLRKDLREAEDNVVMLEAIIAERQKPHKLRRRTSSSPVVHAAIFVADAQAVDIRRIYYFIQRHPEFARAYYDQENPLYPHGCETFSYIVGKAMEEEDINVYVLSTVRHTYLSALCIMLEGETAEIIIDYTADQILSAKVSPLVDRRENLKKKYPQLYNIYWPEHSTDVRKVSEVYMDLWYMLYISVQILLDSYSSSPAASRHSVHFSSDSLPAGDSYLSAIRRAMQRLRQVGPLEQLMKMSFFDISDSLGFIEIKDPRYTDLTTDFIFNVSNYESVVQERNRFTAKHRIGGELTVEKLLSTIPNLNYIAPEARKFPLLASIHPEIKGPGIYYHKGNYKRAVEIDSGYESNRITIIFHELLENEFPSQGLVDKAFSRYFRHSHPLVSLAEILFAAALGQGHLNESLSILSAQIDDAEWHLQAHPYKVRIYSNVIDAMRDPIVNSRFMWIAQKEVDGMNGMGRAYNELIDKLVAKDPAWRENYNKAEQERQHVIEIIEAFKRIIGMAREKDFRKKVARWLLEGIGNIHIDQILLPEEDKRPKILKPGKAAVASPIMTKFIRVAASPVQENNSDHVSIFAQVGEENKKVFDLTDINGFSRDWLSLLGLRGLVSSVSPLAISFLRSSSPASSPPLSIGKTSDGRRVWLVPSWKPNYYNIYDGVGVNSIGTFDYRLTPAYVHVSDILIYCQKKGIGKLVLKWLAMQAYKNERKLKISSIYNPVLARMALSMLKDDGELKIDGFIHNKEQVVILTGAVITDTLGFMNRIKIAKDELVDAAGQDAFGRNFVQLSDGNRAVVSNGLLRVAGKNGETVDSVNIKYDDYRPQRVFEGNPDPGADYSYVSSPVAPQPTSLATKNLGITVGMLPEDSYTKEIINAFTSRDFASISVNEQGEFAQSRFFYIKVTYIPPTGKGFIGTYPAAILATEQRLRISPMQLNILNEVMMQNSIRLDLRGFVLIFIKGQRPYYGVRNQEFFLDTGLLSEAGKTDLGIILQQLLLQRAYVRSGLGNLTYELDDIRALVSSMRSDELSKALIRLAEEASRNSSNPVSSPAASWPSSSPVKSEEVLREPEGRIEREVSGSRDTSDTAVNHSSRLAKIQRAYWLARYRGEFSMSLFVISGSSGEGSGFVADKIGRWYILITNSHVVGKDRSVRVRINLKINPFIAQAFVVLRNPNVNPENIVAEDPDLALLVLDENQLPGADLSPFYILPRFYKTSLATLVSGRNHSVASRDLEYAGDEARLLGFTCKNGDSGSPYLINLNHINYVVAVNAAKRGDSSVGIMFTNSIMQEMLNTLYLDRPGRFKVTAKHEFLMYPAIEFLEKNSGSALVQQSGSPVLDKICGAASGRQAAELLSLFIKSRANLADRAKSILYKSLRLIRNPPLGSICIKYKEKDILILVGERCLINYDPGYGIYILDDGLLLVTPDGEFKISRRAGGKGDHFEVELTANISSSPVDTPAHTPKRLEIGFGDITFMELLIKALNIGRDEIMGIDIDWQKIKSAKELGFNVELADITTKTRFEDGWFEQVYLNHPDLQFIDNALNSAVKEMYRLLSATGQLLIVLPVGKAVIKWWQDALSRYGFRVEIRDRPEDYPRSRFGNGLSAAKLITASKMNIAAGYPVERGPGFALPVKQPQTSSSPAAPKIKLESLVMPGVFSYAAARYYDYPRIRAGFQRMEGIVLSIALIMYLRDCGKLTEPLVKDLLSNAVISSQEKTAVEWYPVATQANWGIRREREIQKILQICGYDPKTIIWAVHYINVCLGCSSREESISLMARYFEAEPLNLKRLIRNILGLGNKRIASSSPVFEHELTVENLEAYYQLADTPLAKDTLGGKFAPLFYGDIKSLISHLRNQRYLRSPSRATDLGSGDGRVVMNLATLERVAKVVGYEIDGGLFNFSNNVHRFFGNNRKVEFRREDLLSSCLYGYDLYFYYARSLKEWRLLADKLITDAPDGALIIIYQYRLDGLFYFLQEHGFRQIDVLRLPYFSRVEGELATSFAILQRLSSSPVAQERSFNSIIVLFAQMKRRFDALSIEEIKRRLQEGTVQGNTVTDEVAEETKKFLSVEIGIGKVFLILEALYQLKPTDAPEAFDETKKDLGELFVVLSAIVNIDRSLEHLAQMIQVNLDVIYNIKYLSPLIGKVFIRKEAYIFRGSDKILRLSAIYGGSKSTIEIPLSNEYDENYLLLKWLGSYIGAFWLILENVSPESPQPALTIFERIRNSGAYGINNPKMDIFIGLLQKRGIIPEENIYYPRHSSSPVTVEINSRMRYERGWRILTGQLNEQPYLPSAGFSVGLSANFNYGIMGSIR